MRPLCSERAFAKTRGGTDAAKLRFRRREREGDMDNVSESDSCMERVAAAAGRARREHRNVAKPEPVMQSQVPALLLGR